MLPNSLSFCRAEWSSASVAAPRPRWMRVGILYARERWAPVIVG